MVVASCQWNEYALVQQQSVKRKSFMPYIQIINLNENMYQFGSSVSDLTRICVLQVEFHGNPWKFDFSVRMVVLFAAIREQMNRDWTDFKFSTAKFDKKRIPLLCAARCGTIKHVHKN